MRVGKYRKKAVWLWNSHHNLSSAAIDFSLYQSFLIGVDWVGFAIELYFDPALENQILRAWNVLSLRQIQSRPHVTLFFTPSLDPTKLQQLLIDFASKQKPLSLAFSTLASFPNDENTLFLSPTPSLSLLTLQRKLCDDLRAANIEVGQGFCPDSWVPHCIIARDVPKNHMAEAFSVLRDLKLPITGFGMEIGLVAGVHQIFSYTLIGDEE